jgi:type IV pilus assembly protein PilA
MKSMQKGFTLIELMVVIAVIGILAAIALVSLTGVQRTARDAQRKSDVSSYKTALERYYADNQAYPTSSVATGDVSAPAVTAGSIFAAGPLITTYMPGLLQDPASTTTNCRASNNAATQCTYKYIASGGSYAVWTYCENTGLAGFNNLFYTNGKGASGGCGSGTGPAADPPAT